MQGRRPTRGYGIKTWGCAKRDRRRALVNVEQVERSVCRLFLLLFFVYLFVLLRFYCKRIDYTG